MTKPELIVLWKKVRVPVFICLTILLFLLLQNCNNNRYNKLKGEYTLLEQKYDTEKQVVKIFEENRIKERDSLNEQITIRENDNKKLADKNADLQSKINIIKDRKIIVPKDALSQVKYFNERYDTNDNVVIEDKVALTNNVSQEVILDLELGDNCSKTIPLKDEQINNQTIQIINLEKDKKDIKTQLTTAEEDIEKRKALEKTADDNIKNLEEQVETLETKSLLNKIIVPVSFVLGAYIGHELSK